MREFFTSVKQFSLRVTMSAGHTVLNSVNQKLIEPLLLRANFRQRKKTPFVTHCRYSRNIGIDVKLNIMYSFNGLVRTICIIWQYFFC